MTPSVPTFTIKVDGIEIPPEAKEAVLQLLVESDLEMAASLKLQLNDEKAALIDSPLFAGGRGIEVELGYLDQPLTRVFSGEIVRRETFFQLHGRQTATVHAFDRSHRLERTRHTRSFQQMSDAAIVRQIGREEGMAVNCDPTPEVFDYVFQNNETNLSFLAGRAERLGFELSVDERAISFIDPSLDATPLTELKWGHNLLSFEPRLSLSHVPTEVEVRSWAGVDQRMLIGRARSRDIGYTMGALELASDVALRSFGDAREIVVSRPMQDELEADALARSLMERLSASYVEGQGSCHGDPRLQSGKIVRIDGVGKRFAGVYVLKKTHHLFEPSGYSTSFSMRRIGHGETALAKPPPLPPRKQLPPEVEKKVRSFFHLDVKDPFGAQFAGEKAVVLDHSTQTRQIVQLDDAGRFRKEGIEPGRFSVLLRQLRKASFSVARLRLFAIVRVEKGDRIGLRALAARHGMSTQKLLEFDGGTGIANMHRLKPLSGDRLPVGSVVLVPLRGRPKPIELKAEALGFAAGTPARVELYAQFRERPEDALKVWQTQVDDEGWVKAAWDGKSDTFVPGFVFKVRVEKMLLTSPPLVQDRGPRVPPLAGELSDLGVAGKADAVDVATWVGMRLLDMHGYPLAYQDVQVLDISGQVVARGMSDAQGHYGSLVKNEGDFEVRLLDSETPPSSSDAVEGLPRRADRPQDGIYHVVVLLKDRATRKPLFDVAYNLTLPDGKAKSGRTGRNGLIISHSVPRGEARLEVFGKEHVVPCCEDLDFKPLEHAEKVPVKPFVLSVLRPDDAFEAPELDAPLADAQLELLLKKPAPLPFQFKQKFTPNRSQRQGALRYVLLGCSREQSHRVLEARIRDPKSRYSVHYSVGRDGQVFGYVSPSQKAWHAFRVRHDDVFVDDVSLSILLEGDGDAQPYPEKQLTVLAQLTHRLLTEQGLDESTLKPAQEIAPDAPGPGQHFDWQDFFTRLERARAG